MVVWFPLYPNDPLNLIRECGGMVGLRLVLGDMSKSRHRFDSPFAIEPPTISRLLKYSTRTHCTECAGNRALCSRPARHAQALYARRPRYPELQTLRCHAGGETPLQSGRFIHICVVRYAEKRVVKIFRARLVGPTSHQRQTRSQGVNTSRPVRLAWRVPGRARSHRLFKLGMLQPLPHGWVGATKKARSGIVSDRAFSIWRL